VTCPDCGRDAHYDPALGATVCVCLWSDRMPADAVDDARDARIDGRTYGGDNRQKGCNGTQSKETNGG
jgi:hypothetical protein